MVSYKERELIKDYLSGHEAFKLTDICNYLVSNGSSTDKYSTGKYKIFPIVGAYIKSNVPRSELEMRIIDNDVEYTKVGNLSFVPEIDVEVQDSKEQKKGLEQLRLF